MSLIGPNGTLTLRMLTPGIRRVLKMLANGGASEDVLSDCVLTRDGAGALPLWYYWLEALRGWGALCLVLRQGGKTLARLTPSPRPLAGSRPGLANGGRYRLTRFAYLRPDGVRFVLVSPLSGASLELTDERALAMVGVLCRPATVRQLAEAAPGIGADMARAFLSLLSAGRMLDDAEQGVRQWDFGDVVFHASSRRGPRFIRSEPEVRSSRRPPPPAVKRSMSTRVINLRRPDLSALESHDVPFTRVLEQRRSVRSYGAVPLSVAELGEFLFRVARIKRVIKRRGPPPGLPQLTRRPYPSGGACYGLELYAVIGSCRGIPPAIYHYDPMRHRLESLVVPQADADRLLDDARRASGRAAPPQVLLVITARFGRVAWKYRTVAYALVLKEVGALYQTMYLVATAMHLAPCALGGGDSELFAQIIGTDFYEETSVGEFLLGSLEAQNSSS